MGIKDGFVDTMDISGSGEVAKILGKLENGNLQMRITNNSDGSNIFTAEGKLSKEQIKINGDIMGVIEYSTDITGDMSIEGGYINYGGKINTNNNFNSEENLIDFKIYLSKSNDIEVTLPGKYKEIEIDTAGFLNLMMPGVPGGMRPQPYPGIDF